MSGEVLPFVRPGESPHASGIVVCGCCGHEWAQAAPLGETDFACPACNTHRGHWKFEFGPAEGQYGFTCSCGCDNFYIMKRAADQQPSVFCRGCGLEAMGWFE